MADKWHYNGKIYRAKLMFAWYDLWLGVFVDKDRRRVYVFPIPMFGVCFEFRRWFWSRDAADKAPAIGGMTQCHVHGGYGFRSDCRTCATTTPNAQIEWRACASAPMKGWASLRRRGKK